MAKHVWIRQGQRPGMALQGQRPGMSLQGQRPGIIPAWGIAPGIEPHNKSSANGAAYHSGGVVCRGCQNMRHDGSGLQPLVAFADDFLGRCPRLGWDAPLALETVALEVSSATSASSRFLAVAREVASCVSNWSTKAIS